jgi:segregation and condensation protein B
MELKSIIESLLFSSSRPLSVEDIRQVIQGVGNKSEDLSLKVFQNVKGDKIEQELRLLQDEYEELNRTWRLTCVAQNWQFVCLPEYAPWIRFFTGEKARPPRLTPPALETLAIIAYRQPITRSEVEDIRGVSVDGVIGTLLERNLVFLQGKADLPGRPTLYGTTPEFLQYFGLSSLDDLPDASELRRYAINPLQTVGKEVERQTEENDSGSEEVER